MIEIRLPDSFVLAAYGLTAVLLAGYGLTILRRRREVEKRIAAWSAEETDAPVEGEAAPDGRAER